MRLITTMPPPPDLLGNPLNLADLLSNLKEEDLKDPQG